jgi:3-dehydroquinate dehydratase type I
MICVSIFEQTTEAAIAAMKEAAPQADLLELRLDAMAQPDLKALLAAKPRPVIVSARTLEDGGHKIWKEPARLALLGEALQLGAEFIDIELRSGPEVIERLVKNKGPSGVIVSWHTFANTPKRPILRERMKAAFEAGADVCKLATLALSPLDNGRMLEVVATAAQREKKSVIGFCMGEKGRLSRIATLFMGGMLTYAYLRVPLAPGMMSLEETRRLLTEFGYLRPECQSCNVTIGQA